MHAPLHLLPNGFVDQLLSLHGSFSLKHGGDDLNLNVRAIGIVEGPRDFDGIGLQGGLYLLLTDGNDGSRVFRRHEARERERRLGRANEEGSCCCQPHDYGE